MAGVLRGGKTIWWDADGDHRGFAPQKVTCKLKPEQVKSNSRRRCRERTLQGIFSQSVKPTRNPAHKWIHGLEISVPAEHWRWVAAKQQEYFWRRKGISGTQVQGQSHSFQLWICTLENSRESGSSRVRGRPGWRRRIVQGVLWSFRKRSAKMSLVMKEQSSGSRGKRRLSSAGHRTGQLIGLRRGRETGGSSLIPRFLAGVVCPPPRFPNMSPHLFLAHQRIRAQASQRTEYRSISAISAPWNLEIKIPLLLM